MVVLDELALYASVVVSNDSAAADGQPLDEVVEGLALVRRCLDRGPQLRIAEVRRRKPVRTATPNSRKARYRRFLRLYVPSLRKIVEGVIVPAAIDTPTGSMSGR
jgi:hypothetical protein